MGNSIVPATPQSLAKFLAEPAAKIVGRPARPFKLFTRTRPISVAAKRKAGYLVPLDEHYAFPEQMGMEADESGCFEQFNEINWS